MTTTSAPPTGCSGPRGAPPPAVAGAATPHVHPGPQLILLESSAPPVDFGPRPRYCFAARFTEADSAAQSPRPHQAAVLTPQATYLRECLLSPTALPRAFRLTASTNRSLVYGTQGLALVEPDEGAAPPSEPTAMSMAAGAGKCAASLNERLALTQVCLTEVQDQQWKTWPQR